ncbi:MAG: hypothetical protein IT427_01830 [Pirellulales bacterium]|nr:hypothetical protein [Pirellulales bacterium]
MVSAAFQSDFTQLPVVPNFNNMNVGATYIYQVDFVLLASDFNAAANQRGFGNIAFDIALAGDSLQSALNRNWLTDIPLVDTNGSQGGGLLPLLDLSADIGGDTDDMMDIFSSIDVIPSPNPADPRPHVGESPGTVLGFMYLSWDGIGPETVTAQPQVTANGPQVSFARIDNGQFQQDLAAVLMNATLTFGIAPSNGDFDTDGDVDGADFVIWQTHYPTATGATLAEGDADLDGDIDGADFVLWQTNFPSPISGAAAVPEPSAWVGCALGWMFISWRLRRR